MYEAHLLEHIRVSQFRGMAIDVGAHIGNHSLYFAKVCGLQVMAFEPIHFQELFNNITINPHLDVRAFCCALGAHEGYARPVGAERQKAPAGGWGLIELTESDDVSAFPVHTLDSFPMSEVSLIKIDVEGMETDVLEGARATLSRFHPVLFVEAKDEAAHEALSRVLAPLGYTRTLVARTSTPVERWDWS